jgi:opacity protein-like surface antigen/outer membrane protease
MLYRLIVCIAVTGLVREAVAGDIDTAYLRGSENAVIQTPAQEWNAAPYRPVIATPAAPVAPAPPAWFWTGFYVGVHVGAAAGTANFADPFGSTIFGDKVTTPSFLAGGQIGYNWQAPNSNWVVGVEADASWLTSDGTNTCLAFSGLFVSANCRARPNMIGDLTGRIGWAYGYSNHSLLYIKGGAAFVRNQINIETNATASFVGLAPLSTSSSFTKVGWTVGAGVEHAITPAWSVKLEYDYVGLSGETVATPPGLVQPIPGVNLFNFTPVGTTRVTQNFQELNLGLNYKLGIDPSAGWGPASSSVFPVKAPVMVVAPGWELEVGTRYWYSRGTFQKDLGSTTNPASANILNSRLTYNTTADSLELFGRLEAPQNVFMKGNIGGGSLLSGHMNDEDWVLFGGTVAYSNTLSDPVQGDIDYATLDFGYDFFREPGYKLGAFVGYNYYKETKSAYGCMQIANTLSDCAPAIPSSVLVITEDDIWKSFRVGVNGDIMITDRFKLGADVAYLPYVQFNGTDDHILRALTIQEKGAGTGLQLESILSYLITDQVSAGVGGRYWSMWTTKDAIADFAGAPCPCQTQPANTERYGVFFQVAGRL